MKQNNMKLEFIPYQQALALKELGFDEPCFGSFDEKGKLWHYVSNTGQDTIRLGNIIAPVYQQAFRWFREKYNFCYFIRGNNFDGYSYNIDNLGVLQYKFEIEYRFSFKTYEEAELACLIKLIEILNQKL